MSALGWLRRLLGAAPPAPPPPPPPPPPPQTPPGQLLLQVGTAFWQSRALYLAARLDLAGLLADGEADTATLAAQAGAQADALARLLRLLAAMGVFDEVAPGRWRNTALSQPLRADRPGSVRTLLLMHHAPEMLRPWLEPLEQGLRSGQPPFRLQHGRDLADYLAEHPEFDTVVAQAADEQAALTGDGFATAFDWSAFERVFDLSGGRGSKAVALLARHPQLQAVVVDRAPAIRQAERHWPTRQPAELLARLRYAARDLRVSLPAAGGAREAYLLAAVLHGLDDDSATALLRRVAAAAAPVGATIVLLEQVMPDRQADLATAVLDLQMFVNTRGRERGLAAWQALFERSGVRLVNQVPLGAAGSLLVLKPVAAPTAAAPGAPEADAGAPAPG
ncbi:MAG: methyltransferase [Burkholderiales bacterium]|nr:methyltransferase [Burkholderiales bacterium]